MKIKILKQVLAVLILTILLAPRLVWALPQLDLLSPDVVADIEKQTDAGASGFGQAEETTLTQIVANILSVFLGLLGTIFIILVVYAGYTWMTAAGNSEKVTKAQSTLKVAIIGLIIVASAYAITYFIFARLPDAS